MLSAMSDETRLGLPPYPTGWYAVAFSSELKPGAVLPMRYFGRELVAFRSEAGGAALLDAHCPHMGAHMGHGGSVRGDCLRCPFHGFLFDRDGACVSTPYPEGKPPRARAGAWPVLERNGIVLTWFDERGRPPLWEIPVLAPDGFPPLQTKVWRGLASHPQETTENSVDFGHLGVVHGYTGVEILKPLHTDGPYLNTKYVMHRKNPFGLTGRIRAEFEIHVHGLGYSFVDVLTTTHGLPSRHFVLPTPVDEQRIDLRAAVAVRVDEPARLSRALGWAPARAVERMVNEIAIRQFVGDIEQDFAIWENKRYLQPPSLVPGDGPVGPYRKWCRQFYPSERLHAVDTAASA
jgi:phenylpropionate dioxygenase-like ring-hydroxylating dioxygenase large terminal subunit